MKFIIKMYSTSIETGYSYITTHTDADFFGNIEDAWEYIERGTRTQDIGPVKYTTVAIAYDESGKIITEQLRAEALRIKEADAKRRAEAMKSSDCETLPTLGGIDLSDDE